VNWRPFILGNEVTAVIKAYSATVEPTLYCMVYCHLRTPPQRKA